MFVFAIDTQGMRPNAILGKYKKKVLEKRWRGMPEGTSEQRDFKIGGGETAIGPETF